MGWLTSFLNTAKGVWHWISDIGSDVWGAMMDIWKLVLSVWDGLRYIYAHVLTAFLNAISVLAALFTRNEVALRNALNRLIPWYDINRLNPLRAQVLRWFAQLRARIAYLFAVAYMFINLRYHQARAYARFLVAAEHKAMLKAFATAEAYTRRLVSALHKDIEKEAASGYSATLKERTTLIRCIADLIATRNPAVRAIEADLVKIILDLLTVDDPLLRLAAGFMIREIVNRLGIDKVAGQLLADIARPLLGNPKPANLHDVIANIGLRLDVLESQQATFMDDGGAQILQAGREWKDITSYITDAALLAFFSQAVARPQEWASEVTAALGPAVRAATGAVAALLD